MYIMKPSSKISPRKRIVLIIAGIVVLICIIWMAATGTLSYPYIMTIRQIDLIHYCRNGLNTFDTKVYGFQLSAPEGYCIIPNRVFPENATIQVLPKGLYSVLSEYISGTVVVNTRATIYLEPITAVRNTKSILDTLLKGGFLAEAKMSEKILPGGLHASIVRNAKGIEDGSYFDWAFVDHPDGKSVLMLLLPHTNGDATVFDYIVEHLTTK